MEPGMWRRVHKRMRSNSESSKAEARQRRKNKSAAEAEALAKSTRRDDDPDRISELPDEILHHILSFLDMKHVIHTAFLSKRWTTIFKSLPTLSFNRKSYYGDYIYDDIYHVTFKDFVNKVLYLRDSTTNADNSSIIHSLCISCSYYQIMDIDDVENSKDIDDDVNIWIDFAARHDIQQLDFTIEVYDDLPSLDQHPPSLFSCKLLTTLNWTGDINVIMPHDFVVDLPKLKTLHLQNVSFHGETISKNFFSRCPVLETLIITHCHFVDGTLNIIVSEDHQLNYLKIDSLLLQGKPPFHITISAPKLTSLSIRNDQNDESFGEYNLVNMHSLIKSRIYSYKVDSRDLVKFLKGISNVKSLAISASLLQAHDGRSIGNRGCLKDLLNPFHTLKVLKLLRNKSFEMDQIHVIAYLLEKCPYVETLVMQMSTVRTKHPHECGIIVDKECGKAELSSLQFKLNQLKLIEIRGFTGYRNELEFLIFMLVHTPMLEKMVIFAHKKHLSTRNREIYRAMLEASPGVSSKTDFLFL